MSRTCNYGRTKKYIGAHKSKTAQFASAIDNNVTSAFLGRNISKLPTRQITTSNPLAFGCPISKLPTRQITYSVGVNVNRGISKLPTRQITSNFDQLPIEILSKLPTRQITIKAIMRGEV